MSNSLTGRSSAEFLVVDFSRDAVLVPWRIVIDRRRRFRLNRKSGNLGGSPAFSGQMNQSSRFSGDNYYEYGDLNAAVNYPDLFCTFFKCASHCAAAHCRHAP